MDRPGSFFKFSIQSTIDIVIPPSKMLFPIKGKNMSRGGRQNSLTAKGENSLKETNMAFAYV